MVRVLVLLTALASAPLLSGQAAGGAAAGTTLALIPPFGNLKFYLGLTDFQLEQLVQIMNEQNEALMENYRQIAQKEAELNNLLNSGSQDLHRIGRLTIDIHTMRTQPPTNNYRERALAVLTPDQRAKLPALVQALITNPTAQQAVTLNLIGLEAVSLAMPGMPPIMGPAGTKVVPSPQ